jgi:signal transduction histidine kinase
VRDLYSKAALPSPSFEVSHTGLHFNRHAKSSGVTARVRLDPVNLDLARVLNVLAHEIRTPLAVSQGYLKLMAEGHLTTATEQATALERTRDALDKIAMLCSDMGRLSAVTEAPAPSLHARVTAVSMLDAVSDALSRYAPARTGPMTPACVIATDGTHDLAAAVAALGTMACADAGPDDKAMTVTDSTRTSLTLRLGGALAVAGLPAHAGDPDATAPMLVRGGFGLSLLWAAVVLERHGVRAWQGREASAAIGLTFPMVSA